MVLQTAPRAATVEDYGANTGPESGARTCPSITDQSDTLVWRNPRGGGFFTAVPGFVNSNRERRWDKLIHPATLMAAAHPGHFVRSKGAIT